MQLILFWENLLVQSKFRNLKRFSYSNKYKLIIPWKSSKWLFDLFFRLSDSLITPYKKIRKILNFNFSLIPYFFCGLSERQKLVGLTKNEFSNFINISSSNKKPHTFKLSGLRLSQYVQHPHLPNLTAPSWWSIQKIVFFSWGAVESETETSSTWDGIYRNNRDV